MKKILLLLLLITTYSLSDPAGSCSCPATYNGLNLTGTYQDEPIIHSVNTAYSDIDKDKYNPEEYWSEPIDSCIQGTTSYIDEDKTLFVEPLTQQALDACWNCRIRVYATTTTTRTTTNCEYCTEDDVPYVHDTNDTWRYISVNSGVGMCGVPDQEDTIACTDGGGSITTEFVDCCVRNICVGGDTNPTPTTCPSPQITEPITGECSCPAGTTPIVVSNDGVVPFLTCMPDGDCDTSNPPNCNCPLGMHYDTTVESCLCDVPAVPNENSVCWDPPEGNTTDPDNNTTDPDPGDGDDPDPGGGGSGDDPVSCEYPALSPANGLPFQDLVDSDAICLSLAGLNQYDTFTLENCPDGNFACYYSNNTPPPDNNDTPPPPTPTDGTVGGSVTDGNSSNDMNVSLDFNPLTKLLDDMNASANETNNKLDTANNKLDTINDTITGQGNRIAQKLGDIIDSISASTEISNSKLDVINETIVSSNEEIVQRLDNVSSTLNNMFTFLGSTEGVPSSDNNATGDGGMSESMDKIGGKAVDTVGTITGKLNLLINDFVGTSPTVSGTGQSLFSAVIYSHTIEFDLSMFEQLRSYFDILWLLLLAYLNFKIYSVIIRDLLKKL